MERIFYPGAKAMARIWPSICFSRVRRNVKSVKMRGNKKMRTG